MTKFCSSVIHLSKDRPVHYLSSHSRYSSQLTNYGMYAKSQMRNEGSRELGYETISLFS